MAGRIKPSSSKKLPEKPHAAEAEEKGSVATSDLGSPYVISPSGTLFKNASTQVIGAAFEYAQPLTSR